MPQVAKHLYGRKYKLADVYNWFYGRRGRAGLRSPFPFSANSSNSHTFLDFWQACVCVPVHGSIKKNVWRWITIAVPDLFPESRFRAPEVFQTHSIGDGWLRFSPPVFTTPQKEAKVSGNACFIAIENSLQPNEQASVPTALILSPPICCSGFEVGVVPNGQENVIIKRWPGQFR